MKKNLFLVLVLAALFFDAAAGQVSVVNKGTTFNVHYKSGQVGDTKIAILDSDGREIFNEVIRKQACFIRPYNFSDLPYGDYTIVASNKFSKEATKVKYRETEEVELQFRVLKLINDRYLLSVPNLKDNQITVSIAGETSGVLYSKTINTTGDFASVYNIQNVHPEEAITFQITTTRSKQDSAEILAIR